MKTKQPDRRGRRLPTSVPIAPDPQFIPKFMEGGWARVNRIWGKRAQVWIRVIGLQELKAMRREYLVQKAQGVAGKRRVEG